MLEQLHQQSRQGVVELSPAEIDQALKAARSTFLIRQIPDEQHFLLIRALIWEAPRYLLQLLWHSGSLGGDAIRAMVQDRIQRLDDLRHPFAGVERD